MGARRNPIECRHNARWVFPRAGRSIGGGGGGEIMSDWLSDWYEGVHSSAYDLVWWTAVGLIVVVIYYGIRIFLSDRASKDEYNN